MAEVKLHLGLTSAFSSRFKLYLAFLEMTNHTDLFCQITDFLTTKELFQLLITSQHFYNLQKIQSIQIRILRAKLNFYKKPEPQPTIKFYFESIHSPFHNKLIEMTSEQIKKKSSLKQFNMNIKLLKGNKKTEVSSSSYDVEKYLKQPINNQSSSDKTHSTNSSYDQRSISIMEETHKIERKKDIGLVDSNSEKAMIRKLQIKDSNPLIQRFMEIQYKLIREDYQKMKFKKMLSDQNPLASLEKQLRKKGQSDPYSLQIYLKLFEEQKHKIQRENISKLKMKSCLLKPEQMEELIPATINKEMPVISESVTQKIVKNIKSAIWKQKKIISI